MSLPIPTLDNLVWLDLVTEARERIPSSAPAWTDHNTHDPGITLIELLAWLVERTGFRIDQIPSGHRRRFLDLVGLGTRAAAPPARAVIEARLEPPVVVDAGWRLEVDIAGRPPVPFTIERGCRATPAAVSELLAGGRPVGWTAPGAGFEPFGPEGDQPLLVELDPSAPAGPLTLWFGSTDEPPLSGPPAAVAGPTADAAGAVASPVGVTLGWSYRTGAGTWTGLDRAAVVDGTAALSRSGFVQLDLPEDGVTALRVAPGGGRYDRAPRLDAVLVNAVAVVQTEPVVARETWFSDELTLQLGSTHVQEVTRLTTDDGGGPVPWPTPTAPVPAPDQRQARFDPERGTITFSDGRWARRPRPADAVAVDLIDSWGPVGNIAPGTADWFLLPPEVEVDGEWVQPRRPVPDPPRGSGGGAEAETIDEAVGRAARALRAHERLIEIVADSGGISLDDVDGRLVRSTAVPVRCSNLLDYERSALDTPGIRLARVRAWAELDPDLPCAEARGTVTVVVVPHLPAARPVASAVLVGAVDRRLRNRKLAGTRLRVTGPAYTPVRLRVVVDLVPGADPARVTAAVDDAVRTFLHPLRGGPRGRGWPFGRDVHRTEVMAAAAPVPGVDLVAEVDLWSGSEAACQSVCVPPHHLVAVESLTVEVRR